MTPNKIKPVRCWAVIAKEEKSISFDILRKHKIELHEDSSLICIEVEIIPVEQVDILMDIFYAAKDLGCVCENGIGHPLVSDHSDTCKYIRRLVESYQKLTQEEK